jgi:hypothetical protein
MSAKRLASTCWQRLHGRTISSEAWKAAGARQCRSSVKPCNVASWRMCHKRRSSGFSQEKTQEISDKATGAAHQAEQKLSEAVEQAQAMSDKALKGAKVRQPCFR